MVSEPEETSTDEVEEVGEKKGRGRLRLGILLAVLVSMAVFAAATGRLQLPGAQPQREPAQNSYNNFDVSNATIPIEEIRRGGPPRDGIPSIDEPKFVSVSDADFLLDGDQVFGFAEKGDVRAYPLRILVWHEIVNDTVGGRPVAVTYCPLCGTCMVFDRRSNEGELTFGVSGLLYNSDVLMYDRETESLWSQLMMEAVAGPQAGQKMRWLASEQMTWAAWKERYPDSKVLSRESGNGRNYLSSPYAGYELKESTMFPFAAHRDDLRNKEWVVGVVVEGLPKAYPIKELELLGAAPLEDTLGGIALTVTYDKEKEWATVTQSATGVPIPSVRSFWFAWQAFYPRTELYKAPNADGADKAP